jgi:hypothetical protein
MTAIAVRTTSNTSVTIAATTIAATAPASIADGDLLIACIAKNTTGTPSTVPTGWALATAYGAKRAGFAAGTTLGAAVGTGWAGIYWKKAASESGSYTWGSTSSVWNVQILRCSTFRGAKPGSAFVDTYLFGAGKVNTRATNTISQGLIPICDLESDGYLMIHQFVQTVATTAPVFSALSGTMTPVANVSINAAAAVTQEVAWEYIDMTANPNFGSRQVTTDTASGSTGGYCVLINDPSSVAGTGVDKRNDLRARAA